MDSLSRGITIILVGVLLFILPLQYINDNYEFIAHKYTSEKTSEFTDSIRQQGYLTSEMYGNYVNELNATGELYNIEIEVASTVVGSEKSFSSENKGIMINQKEDTKAKAIFLGGNERNTSDKSDLNLSSNINKLLPLATHSHTDACYNGTKHSHTGSSSSGGGCYGAVSSEQVWVSHSHSSSCYISKNVSCKGSITWSSAGSGYYYCEYCKKNVLVTAYQGSCNSCGGWGGTTDARSCPHGSSPSSYPCSRTTTEKELVCTLGSGYWSTSYYYSINCGKTVGNYYNGSTLVNPNCANVVLSISPTKLNQTVILGENIVTTANATYLDGHTGTVVCNNNYKKEIGTQTVTLSYTGLIGNAKSTSTLTSTITVITKPNVFPTSIIVTPSSFEVYNGNEPTYNVVIGYSDNTSKSNTNGYVKTGFTKGAGTKEVLFSYTENEKTVTTFITIIVKRNLKVCTYGHTYELDDNDVDKGCQTCKEYLLSLSVAPKIIQISKGEDLKSKVTVIGTYLDGHTEEIKDWTSDFNPNKSGMQFVEIAYKNLYTLITVEVIDKIICGVCGSEYDALEDGTDPGCPVCKEEIVSITATPKSITVPVGTDMNIKVIATFKDGHTAEVENWSSNFDTYREGKQLVTIFYNKFTTTVTVTVMGSTTICPVCNTEYSWKENPYGCPVCSITIESIEAYHKNESSLVTYGSNLSIYVILNYLDGHKEIAATGWAIEGYNPTQLGEQTVIVRYGIHSTSLKVTVINNLEKVTCPNGHVYYLNDDGSDPGCPYCMNTDLDKGTEYITILFTKDILQELELNNKIIFNKGDYITVKTITRELGDKKNFLKTLYNLDRNKNEVIYGGRIL